MSLSSAMLTGFTGIQANQTSVDVVGDNIANLNTTAFKVQRTQFETMYYQTIHGGTAPGTPLGGTLPEQIGRGTQVSAIQRDFRGGNPENTGVPSDLAIDGSGFFMVGDPADAQPLYTRDGAFHLDATNTMVANNGDHLLVYGADADGNITPGTLTDLVIPLGTASVAVPTSNVVMDGQLNAAADPATQAAVISSQALTTSGGAAATAATQLSALVDSQGTPLFADGDVVTVNAQKGGLALSELSFTVGTDGSTLGDFASFLEAGLGIDTDPGTGDTPGVTISAGPDPAAGSLVITSNAGSASAIELPDGAIQNTGSLPGSPFSFTTETAATGDAVTTSFQVFDALGNPIEVRLRASLSSQSEQSTTWRYTAEAVEGGGPVSLLGSGTITFDGAGQFVAATGNAFTIDRAAAGAASPLAVTVDFSGLTGLASSGGSSELIMASQDGRGTGLLTNYEIDEEGIVTGVYSNDYRQTLAQIPVATFANDQGLIALSENRYEIGPASGDPTILLPTEGVAGAMRSGVLEESNVEITREFINLLSAQTGIQSASRVVRTADELLQELLLLAR
jgi:flagellar hook protein FlgE